MSTLAGHCHCGAIRVELEPGRPVGELALRACQCGFCRRHGARTTSDPKSFLHIEAAPGALERYRFGRRVADILLCAECGCYIASTIEADGRLLATLNVTGVDVEGYRVLRCTSPAIPNAIAGLLLDMRDRTHSIPHAYFGWSEGNPFAYLLKFLAFGEGDTAPVCREVLRQAESDPERRPRIHVG